MPTEETLYPEKTLIYQICKFLSDRRRKITGLGGPLSFELEEFEELFEFAIGDNDEEKIMSLYSALSILDHEFFGPTLDRKVINILNMPNKVNFIDSFNNNDSIVIKYSSEDVDDYEEELKTRTRVAVRHHGLAELVHLHSGGVKIILGDQEMQINNSRRNTLNLSSNIVKLLYGESVSILRQDISLGTGYERGDLVFFDDLLEIFHNLDDFAEQDEAEKLLSIKHVAIKLNKRAISKFGKPLFEKNTEGIKWNL